MSSAPTVTKRWYLYTNGTGAQLFAPGDRIWGEWGWASTHHEDWTLVAYFSSQPSKADLQRALEKWLARP